MAQTAMDGETYAKSYWPSERENIRRTLAQTGERLDDQVVLQLFYFMAWRKGVTKRHALIVDPLLLDSVIQKGDHGRQRQYVLDTFQSGKEAAPLVVLPLVCGVHWSLLVYRQQANHWYHMDSMAPLHQSLAERTYMALVEAGVGGNERTQLKYVKVPRQVEGWECGLYTVQYMLAAMQASRRAASNESRFRALLAEFCKFACDANLELFVSRVLQEI